MEMLIPHDMMTSGSELNSTLGGGGGGAEDPVGPAHEWVPRKLVATTLQLAGLDPMPTHDEEAYSTPGCLLVQQIESVCTFTGKGVVKVEDWVRDMRQVLYSVGPMLPCDQFHEIVRYTGGRARDLILNLELRGEEYCTPAAAFREVLEEYGDGILTSSPMACFYTRVQQPHESPSEYAISLEAKLRVARERDGQAATYDEEVHDVILCTHFMHGLRDHRVHDCLAPMRPRQMTFKELRMELRIIEASGRLNLAQEDRQELETSTVEKPNEEEITNTLHKLISIQHQQSELLRKVMDEQRQKRDRIAVLERCLEQASAHQGRRTAGGGNEGRKPQSTTSCYRCDQPDHFSRASPHRQEPHGNLPLNQQLLRNVMGKQPVPETPPTGIKGKSMRHDLLHTSDGRIRIFRPPRIDSSKLVHTQRTHVAIGRVIQLVTRGQKPSGQQCVGETRLVRRLLRKWNQLELQQGILVYRASDKDKHVLPILPRKYRHQILQSIHRQMGHIGFDRTLSLLKSQCYWPSLAAEVRSHANRCGRYASCTPSDLLHRDGSRDDSCENGEAVGGSMRETPRAVSFPSDGAQGRQSNPSRDQVDNLHRVDAKPQRSVFPRRRMRSQHTWPIHPRISYIVSFVLILMFKYIFYVFFNEILLRTTTF